MLSFIVISYHVIIKDFKLCWVGGGGATTASGLIDKFLWKDYVLRFWHVRVK